MSHPSQAVIDLAWEGRTALNPTNADPKIREAVERHAKRGRVEVSVWVTPAGDLLVRR